MECPICCESAEDMKETVCGHHFCKACLDKWMKDHYKCPYCRQLLQYHTGKDYGFVSRPPMLVTYWKAFDSRLKIEIIIKHETKDLPPRPIDI